MKGALLILIAMVVVGVVLWVYDVLKYGRKRKVEDPPGAGKPRGSECCGLHLVCEKDIPRHVKNTADVYFDDEELDRFAGRDASDYSEAETDEFRKVLYTMQVGDIADWNSCLGLRGITPPEEIRDEMLMIISEARQQ